MARTPKLPELDHVKYVRSKGKVYAYFNTGKLKDGKPIYAPLPSPSAVGFYDSWAAMKGARTKHEATGYTIAELVDQYEDSTKFRARSDGTQIAYRKASKRIKALLGEHPVNDLQPEDLQLVLDNEMAGPGAHNMFVAVLGVIYTWARKRGKTKLEPTRDIDKLKTGAHAPWPEHILQAGLKAEHDRTRLAIHLLYYTGQRIGDVVAMRWSDIQNGWLHIVQEKRGHEVRMPIHRDLAAELERTPKRGLTILVNHNGDPISRDIIRKELKRFTSGLGYETVPHGLRKNAVNALLEAGSTVPETAAITGQTFRVVEHYAARVNRKVLSEAAILKFENKGGSGKRVENS